VGAGVGELLVAGITRGGETIGGDFGPGVLLDSSEDLEHP